MKILQVLLFSLLCSFLPGQVEHIQRGHCESQLWFKSGEDQPRLNKTLTIQTLSRYNWHYVFVGFHRTGLTGNNPMVYPLHTELSLLGQWLKVPTNKQKGWWLGHFEIPIPDAHELIGLEFYIQGVTMPPDYYQGGGEPWYLSALLKGTWQSLLYQWSDLWKVKIQDPQ